MLNELSNTLSDLTPLKGKSETINASLVAAATAATTKTSSTSTTTASTTSTTPTSTPNLRNPNSSSNNKTTQNKLNSNNNNNNSSSHNNNNSNSNSNSNNNNNSRTSCTSISRMGVTLTDSLKKKKKKSKNLHDIFLEILDIVLSCLVVAPCVIAYWRGTWELMGALIFPGNVPLSASTSFLIGGIGHMVFTLTQTYFKDYIHPDKRRLTYYMVSRCYTAIFGIICVNMWRGSWILCDWLTSTESLMIICIVTLVALMFLVATRTLRNLSAAPYTVTMDHKTDYFEVDTMFKVPGFHQPSLYLLDTLFSVFVIGTLVVIAWRGLWGIMDLTLFPKQKAKSALGSLIIGYITVFITFIIQPLVRIICKHLDGLFKLVVCDIFYFFTFFGAVNAWRGIWNLLDVYFYPDNPLLSYSLTHIIPFLILAALKCSNSILVRGVFIDADGPGGECVDIPINYVRLHFERERSKKHCRQHHLDKNLEKEAQSILIEKPMKIDIKPALGPVPKPTNPATQSVPGYDNSQFVV